MFDAFREIGRLFPVMSVRGTLSRDFALFEAAAILPDERHEFIGAAGVNVTTVLTCSVVNLFGAELPHDLDFGASLFGDGGGDGYHPAKLRLPDLGDIVLDHERIADSFDVDRHGDVRRRL
jgi:hypothetical protein